MGSPKVVEQKPTQGVFIKAFYLELAYNAYQLFFDFQPEAAKHPKLMSNQVSVLFVCLGNICRSPTAEGIFHFLVEEAGLSDKIRIDSAGTGDWHVGKAPDERMQAAAQSRGYDLSGLTARQIQPEDLDTFDYVLVMDKQNQADVEDLVTELEQMDKIRLLLSFNPSAITEVPDPYYGDESGFQQVIDLVESACKRLLVQLRKNHDL